MEFGEVLFSKHSETTGDQEIYLHFTCSAETTQAEK